MPTQGVGETTASGDYDGTEWSQESGGFLKFQRFIFENKGSARYGCGVQLIEVGGVVFLERCNIYSTSSRGTGGGRGRGAWGGRRQYLGLSKIYAIYNKEDEAIEVEEDPTLRNAGVCVLYQCAWYVGVRQTS